MVDTSFTADEILIVETDFTVVALVAQVLPSQSTFVVIAAVVAAAALSALLYLVHRYMLSKAKKELEAFKERVVALSDKIDALKERRKLLPHLDKDFTVPMAGETLSTYNTVGELLERYRGEWLQLMDVWEQSQSLLQSESLLGFRKSREARRQVQRADASEAMKKVLQDCEAPLDRIEKAHERVREKLKLFDEAQEQFRSHMQAVDAASLATGPYQAEAEAAKSLIQQSRTMIAADPLGSLRCLEDSEAKYGKLRQKVETILEHARSFQQAGERITQVTQLAGQRRDQGFLLKETEANPDPLLEQARQQHSAVWGELNRANETAAGDTLEKVNAAIQQAQHAIDRHVAARSHCENEVIARRNDLLRLGSMQTVVRGQQAELERDFAPEIWSSVTDSLQRGQTCLASAQRFLEMAEQQAAVDVQNYFQATRLLAQTSEHQKQAEGAFTAIGQRLRELIELRIKCQSQISNARVLADRVARLLSTHTADRVRANERFRNANGALEQLVQNSRLARPDWVRLAARLSEVQSDFERAEQLAREDIQLAQQAAAEVAETETIIRDARTFQEFGFVPDLSGAETQLLQARGRLTAQEYEETIRLANAAEQLAREAKNDAMAKAQRRQQEIDAQRRAEEAARAAANAKPGMLIGNTDDEPLLERGRV